MKLVGRFYCERCGKRAAFSRRLVWRTLHVLGRRCKCGARWAEEGTAAP